MKPVLILLSLSIGATAQGPAGEVMGSIRGRKLAKSKMKRDAVSSRIGTKRRTNSNKKGISSPSSLNLKDDTRSARQKLSRRELIGDKLNKVLIKKNGRGSKAETQEKTKTQRVDEEKEDRKLVKKAINAHVDLITNSQEAKLLPEKGKESNEQARELKKAKSFKGGYGGDWEDSHDYGWEDADDMWDDDEMWGGGGSQGAGESSKGGYIFGKANKSGYGSGKSGGLGGWSGGSGKSDKGGWSGWSGGSGKSGKGGWGGWSGGSGKSGKGPSGGSCGDYHYVEVTNLSYHQSFSEIFIMTAEHAVTELMPIYHFGNLSNSALASLAEDADASEMQERYIYRKGVEQVKIFSDFKNLGDEEKYLQGGRTAEFKVSTSGYGQMLSIAVGLPFTNDGAVVLQGAHIYDGAEYLVPPIDAGVEANIQTCWSVAAKEEDFPWQSKCSGDENSDENYNDLPGEGYVQMHRGIQDLDSDGDLKDLLLFPECEELLSDSQLDSFQGFASYFWETGWDDPSLLCSNRDVQNANDCDVRDDQEFLTYLKNNYDDFADDNLFVDLALKSDDFEDFCDLIKETNEAIEDAFDTLEPWLFDWRNDIMHVKIHCGHDEWGGDSWDGHDEWGGDSWNDLDDNDSDDSDDDDDDDDDDKEDMDKRNGDALSFESLHVSGIVKPLNASSTKPMNDTKPVS
jgi:hypothetical protein